MKFNTTISDEFTSVTVSHLGVLDLKSRLLSLATTLQSIVSEEAGPTFHLQTSSRIQRPSDSLKESGELNIDKLTGPFDGRAGSTPFVLGPVGNGSPASAGSDQTVKSSGETTTNFTPLNVQMTSANSAAEVDFDGIPWDARIHSSTKTKTAAGTWTKRKRLADGVYETVLAELKSKAPFQQNAASIPEVSIPEPAAPLNQVETVQTPMISVQLRSGQVGHLTAFEFEQFKTGASYENIIANRGFGAPPVNLTPTVESQQPVNHFGPSEVVVPSLVAPTYDFKTFQGGLPNVLSDLFNKKLIDTSQMNQLAQELQVPALWNVMQDQNKALKLYDILAERGIIQKVNFNERIN